MSIRTWWANVPKKEKPGLIVLGGIVGSILLFGLGFQLGQLMYS
ncbi:hypothetical protein [Thalassotalea fusca]